MNTDLIDWLLESPPWVDYRTRLDLLGEAENDPGVQFARSVMLAYPLVQGLIAELANWPGQVLNGHKSAGHPLHKLVFLADLGLKADDPGMAQIIDLVTAHQSEEGPFQVLMNVSPRYGGTGVDTWTWAACDAPLLLYALASFGLADDPRVRKGVDYMLSIHCTNGWRCTGAAGMGNWRGPGRKGDPCPFVNLIMLKAISALPDLIDHPAAHIGAETLLRCWAERRAQHPYMFYMGTDFCKLKAPLVWYDILNVADTLTRFPWLRGDPRLNEMLNIITTKADAQGRFTIESVWTAWKDWDFGQKKEPSPWLTFLAQRVLQRR